MTDFNTEAEAMFRGIAERQKQNIELNSDVPSVFTFVLSSIEHSHHTVILGLQNGDELNLGIDDFYSYFFPFEEVKSLFEKAAEGWFTGQTRLAYHWRGKRLVKICLQVKLKNGQWQRIYTDYKTWLLPFLVIRTNYKLGAED